jgi:hypothetical protein
MVKLISILCLFALCLSVEAKDIYEKDIEDFNTIALIGRFTIEVQQGDEFQIKYFVDDPEIDTSKINFTLENEELTIRYSGGLATHVDLHFEVTMPSIKSIHCRNGAELKMEKEFQMNGENLTLSSRNGGKMLVRYDEVKELFAKISQGGAIRVIGKAEKATYEVYTGGSIAAVNNDAKDVFAKINFGGEIICAAQDTLEARITSGGTISYQGDPKVDEKVRIGGTVEKL